MPAAKHPPLELLREYLSYDDTTGKFSWRCAPPRSRIKDDPGYVHRNGYIVIRCLGQRSYAHRLAWLFHYGSHPSSEVDHINGVRTDNRISNLRLLPAGLNVQNMRRPSKRSTTGFLGVSLVKKNGTYRASICSAGKSRNLGYYKTPELAYDAYVKAKRELHSPCTL